VLRLSCPFLGCWRRRWHAPCVLVCMIRLAACIAGNRGGAGAPDD
jgi:hypothetical protein